MIKNFKEKTEHRYINVCIYPQITALYEVIESWTEEFVNGDWAGLVRLRYNGSDFVDKVPKEFIIETRITEPKNLFYATMYLRKDGSFKNEMVLRDTELKNYDDWVTAVSKCTLQAGDSILP